MKTKKVLSALTLLCLLCGISATCFAGNMHGHADTASANSKVKKRIISFGFFSPVNQHISFGYDQLVNDKMVFAGQLGIIGPGLNRSDYNSNISYRGAFVEAGVKLYFSPDYIIQGMRRYNAMQGSYFKPQIVFCGFSETNSFYSMGGYAPNGNYYGSTYTRSTQTYAGMAALLNFGKQWIFGQSFSLDIYVGIGYSVNLSTSGNSNNPYYYDDSPTNWFSYVSGGGELPLAFDGGINLGVAIP